MEIIKYRVQDAKHLGFTHRPPWNNDPDKSMTYKYNIYTRPAGGKEKQLDSDIEIDQL